MPRCACSNFPGAATAAPVKEPFSWPNSSDSISSAGTAAQFSVTKGPSRRGLRSCSARAISSLPVPVSPQNANARFAGGDAIHLRHHAAHHFACPHDFMACRGGVQFAVLRLPGA